MKVKGQEEGTRRPSRDTPEGGGEGERGLTPRDTSWLSLLSILWGFARLWGRGTAGLSEKP